MGFTPGRVQFVLGLFGALERERGVIMMLAGGAVVDGPLRGAPDKEAGARA